MIFFNIFPFVSFLVLGMMVAERIISLKKKGVPINSKSSKKRFSKNLIYIAYFLILTIFAFELLKPLFQASILPDILSNPLFNSIYLKNMGVLIISTSLIFMRLVLREFKTSLRFGLNSNNLGKLITAGVFSISRNPFFVSIVIYFTGVALVYPTPIFIIIAVLAIVFIHFSILKEEKFMLKNYGKEYKRYSKKVRRYF